MLRASDEEGKTVQQWLGSDDPLEACSENALFHVDVSSHVLQSVRPSTGFCCSDCSDVNSRRREFTSSTRNSYYLLALTLALLLLPVLLLRFILIPPLGSSPDFSRQVCRERSVLMPWDTYVRIHTYGTYGDPWANDISDGPFFIYVGPINLY